jgi:hypothetical protein
MRTNRSSRSCCDQFGEIGAILVPARGTPAFRPLIPGATSSSPLLIDPPTPSSKSWSPEGGHAQSDKELRASAEQTCLADNAPYRKGYGFIAELRLALGQRVRRRPKLLAWIAAQRPVRRAAARRGLSDPFDHSLGQGPGMEVGLRAQPDGAPPLRNRKFARLSAGGKWIRTPGPASCDQGLNTGLMSPLPDFLQQ